MKYHGCLCEYCTNIELKATAVNQVAHIQKKSSKFEGVYGVSRVTLCPKEDDAQLYKRKCVARQCKDCGTKKLKGYLQDLGDKQVTWKKWEKVTRDETRTSHKERAAVRFDPRISS